MTIALPSHEILLPPREILLPRWEFPRWLKFPRGFMASGKKKKGAGGAAAPLLLDNLSNVVAAYSFRKLRTAYAGSAVRIRRSSDNSEQDIGFVANAFDIATAASFIGGGSGFDAKWYDQSGNGFDLAQTTAGAQPLYVASAVNGKPAARFDGSADNMENAAINQAQPVTHLIVCKYTITTLQILMDGTATQHVIYFNESGNNIRMNAGGTLISTAGPSSDTYNIIAAIFNGASSKLYLNGGTAATGSIGTNAFNTLRVGALRGAVSAYLANDVVEMVSMAVAMSAATLNALGANMAAEYGLTWNTAS